MSILHDSHAQTAQSILKQEYKDDLTLDQALLLAVKVLTKTMDSTTLSSDKRMSVCLSVGCTITYVCSY